MDGRIRPSIRGMGTGRSAGPTKAAERRKADADCHPARPSTRCGLKTSTSGTFFLFNTVVPKTRSATPIRGSDDECLFRATAAGRARETDLSGGSTGVRLEIPRVDLRSDGIQHAGIRDRPPCREFAGWDTDLSDHRDSVTPSSPFYKRTANRTDALKYREQGFGLQALITCVKLRMQGEPRGS